MNSRRSFLSGVVVFAVARRLPVAPLTLPDKSIFIKYLLQELENNDNTYLPSDDLYYEIRLKMKNNATIMREYGDIKDTGDEGGNFVFIQRTQ